MGVELLSFDVMKVILNGLDLFGGPVIDGLGWIMEDPDLFFFILVRDSV